MQRFLLCSGDLDKYEYLTKKDLNYKPDPIQKSRFEYSPLGQVFNKGLDSNERHKGLLKRIENLEDKAENQLDLIDEINNKNRGINFGNERSEISKKRNYRKENEISNNKRSKKEEDRNKSIFKYIATDNKDFNFNEEKNLLYFAEDLYKEKITFDEAEKQQEKIFEAINELEKRINPPRGAKPKNFNKKKKRKILKKSRRYSSIQK